MNFLNATNPRDYIGDGVYVEFDGFDVILRTERECCEHWLSLEPDMLAKLNEFWQRCQQIKPPDVVSIEPYTNRQGDLCGICDGTHGHEHPMSKCLICGATGLAENIAKHVCGSRGGE